MPAKILLAVSGALVLLHVAGAVWSTHLSWGVHLFSFYPPMASLIALAAAAAAIFIPAVQQAAGNALELVVRKTASLPSLVVNLALAGALTGLGYAFAAQLHLLGDSAILMRSIPKSTWGSEVISSFKNQPLLNVIYRWAMDLGGSGVDTHPGEVYTTINIIAGVLLVFLTTWFVRLLPRPPVERFILGLFLFTGAGSQFFFGYVENYVLQYVATIAYAITGWMALEKKVHIAVPVLILAVLPGFNLGTGIFLPSGIFLILYYFRDQKGKALAIIAGIGAAGAAVLYLVGFNFMGFINKIIGGSVDFLPLFAARDGNYPYAMFSLLHLLDWFNAHSLIVPFGVFIPAALMFAMPKEDRWKGPALNFLLILSACGLAFTWIVNSALGMARDWDMLSSFFIPLMVLDVFLLAKAPNAEPRRPVLVTILIVSFLHLAGFIGVNADAERHLARMRTLDSELLLSKASQMTFDEALANFFFDNGRYAEAKIYYERYMAIDSANTRIVGNISDVYRKLGEADNYFRQLKRGVELGSTNPG
ncbi:MAG TPA: hypothetical protein VJO14_03200, partial [Bacteroidota bacterium]|nr:hypothetical protein [Bacteroidota bacterium]